MDIIANYMEHVKFRQILEVMESFGDLGDDIKAELQDWDEQSHTDRGSTQEQ